MADGDMKEKNDELELQICVGLRAAAVIRPFSGLAERIVRLVAENAPSDRYFTSPISITFLARTSCKISKHHPETRRRLKIMPLLPHRRRRRKS